MGCVASKRVDAAAVYRLPPASFALFNVDAVDEPWLSNHDKGRPQGSATASDKVLEKLRTFEVAVADGSPKPWAEVSKALEDLKPAILVGTAASTPPEKPHQAAPPSPATHMSSCAVAAANRPFVSKKSYSFPTAASNRSPPKSEVPRHKLLSRSSSADPMSKGSSPKEASGFRPVRDNVFVVRDRLAKEAGGELPARSGGGGGVVFYSTSLRGVRRTYEECERVRAVLEGQGVAFEERDVALHGGFLREMREAAGEGSAVPRVFVAGMDVGGAEEVVELDESGRLGALLSREGVERGRRRPPCEGCGGRGFVPCLGCRGSCRTAVRGSSAWARCPRCNENGLVRCPVCH